MKYFLLFTVSFFLLTSHIAVGQYTKLLTFTGHPSLDDPSSGGVPYGTLLSDGTFLYGMTAKGGQSNLGTMFKIMPDGTGGTKLLDFGGTSYGRFPHGSLISDGTFLFGITNVGGNNDMGIIFKIKPDGSGYEKLHEFGENYRDGTIPYGSLISEGALLYGMTSEGGTEGYGTIFKIMPDGTGYEHILDFEGGSHGKKPFGSLFSDGTFLYGMTSSGGNNKMGTIFKIKPDGSGYMKLLDFEGVSNGNRPIYCALISDGTFLYGMTSEGGANNYGIIFKIKPDGTGYEKLLDFEGVSNGSNPAGSLLFNGAFLYGMTRNGGNNEMGTIFRIKPDGTGFVKLFDFDGVSNGNNPHGNLISYGNFMYGMTAYGDWHNMGTIFKFKDFTSGINDKITTNKLNIYPNPACDYITVESESTINIIIIADAIGKVVYQQYINSTKAEINTSALCNGIYLVKTSGNQKFRHSRLMINR